MANATSQSKNHVDRHSGERLVTLPTEVFLQIFSLLSFNDRLVCATVCKHWHKYLNESRILWDEIELAGPKELRRFLENITMTENAALYTRRFCVSAVARKRTPTTPFISRKKMPGSAYKSVKSDIELLMAQTWRNIESLILPCPPGMENEYLIRMINPSKTSLRTLCLDYTTATMSNEILAYILNECPNLLTLRLYDDPGLFGSVTEVLDESLLPLLQQNKPFQLRILDVVIRRKVSYQTVLKLVERCPNLSSFSLDMSQLNDAARVSILDWLLTRESQGKRSNLQRMNTFVFSANEDRSLPTSFQTEASNKKPTATAAIATGNPTLLHLSYQSRMGVLPRSDGEINRLAKLVHLRHRVLTSLDFPIEAVYAYYSTYLPGICDMPCLTHVVLRASGPFFPIAEEPRQYFSTLARPGGRILAQFIRGSPNIESFNIVSGLHDLDDNVLGEIGNLKSLRELHIDYCSRISPTGMCDLLRKAQGLKELSIAENSCDNDTIWCEQILEAIAELPKLKKLNIRDGHTMMTSNTLKKFIHALSLQKRSSLKELGLANIQCITYDTIIGCARLRNLTNLVIDLPTSCTIPASGLTQAVHTLFDKRKDITHPLSVTINMDTSPVLSDGKTLHFSSNDYKPSPTARRMGNGHLRFLFNVQGSQQLYFPY